MARETLLSCQNSIKFEIECVTLILVGGNTIKMDVGGSLTPNHFKTSLCYSHFMHLLISFTLNDLIISSLIQVI